MIDIIKPGGTATTDHHMKESSKISSAGRELARNGVNNDSYQSAGHAGFYVANFITCYQDILVVNPKCI